MLGREYDIGRDLPYYVLSSSLFVDDVKKGDFVEHLSYDEDDSSKYHFR